MLGLQRGAQGVYVRRIFPFVFSTRYTATRNRTAWIREMELSNNQRVEEEEEQSSRGHMYL